MRWVMVGGIVLLGCAGRSERTESRPDGSAGEAAVAGAGAGGRATGSAGRPDATGGTDAASGSGGTAGNAGGSVAAGMGGVSGEASGSGGAAPVAGGGGEPGETEALPLGDGGLPLFVNVGDGSESISPPADDDGTLHLVFAEGTAVVTISTHMHHLDLTDLFASVAFEARASRATTVIVSATPVLSNSYSEDIAAGYTWQGTTVGVAESFAAHDLAFENMEPLGPGEARPLSDFTGSAIHFLLADAGGLELWLRNMELRP